MKTVIRSGAVAFAAVALAGSAGLLLATAGPAAAAGVHTAAVPADGSGATATPSAAASPAGEDWN